MEIKLTEKQNAIAVNLLAEKNRIEQMQKINQDKMEIFLSTICDSNGIDNIGNVEYRDGMLILEDPNKEKKEE